MSAKDVEVLQCVVTRLLVRGKGVEGDPIRRVTEVWTLDGKKIAEWDVWDSQSKAFRVEP